MGKYGSLLFIRVVVNMMRNMYKNMLYRPHDRYHVSFIYILLESAWFYLFRILSLLDGQHSFHWQMSKQHFLNKSLFGGYAIFNLSQTLCPVLHFEPSSLSTTSKQSPHSNILKDRLDKSPSHPPVPYQCVL